MRLWDVETGREIAGIVGFENWVWRVAFSPDGCCALSAGGGTATGKTYHPGSDFAIRLWRLP